jgi:cobalt-zinc-cadmium efflux system membrane fusion protein
VAGTIVEQNVSGFEGIKSLDNTPNLFTIADLSQVWVVCDVYENDLSLVRQGDSAEVRLAAYPGQLYHGKIADISRVLDPNLRSAKIRIVLPNPDGALRPNMYAVSTFRSTQLHSVVVVPTAAVMRLHDKDWVFRKENPGQFRKIEVHSSGVTPDGLQELQDGAVKAGDEIAANALEFSSAVAESKE